MHGLINKELEQQGMHKNYCRGKRKVKQNGHVTDEDKREVKEQGLNMRTDKEIEDERSLGR